MSDLKLRTKNEKTALRDKLAACATAKATAETAAKNAQAAMRSATQKAMDGAGGTTRDSESTIAAVEQRYTEELARVASEKNTAMKRQEEEANKLVATLRKQHARDVASLKREISSLAAGHGTQDCIPDMYI